jgi:hypothetical protein
MNVSKPVQVVVIRASPMFRRVGQGLVFVYSAFALAGVVNAFALGYLSEGVMMAIGGMVFAAINYAPAFGVVRVSAFGIEFRDRLWLRRRFITREELDAVEIGTVNGMGGTRDGIYLVAQDGRKHPVAILMAYQTKRGRAWLEGTRELIETTLRSKPTG